jgi:hypothetical protein
VLDPLNVTRLRLCLCAQVLIEYWVVATRPAANNGFGLSPCEADGDLSSLRGLLPCLPELPDVADRWYALVGRYGVSG